MKKQVLLATILTSTLIAEIGCSSTGSTKLPAPDKLIGSDPTSDYSNWMSDNLQLLGEHELKDVVIPGSHDTGMYVVENCTSIATIGANACNTQTQRGSILEQLRSGIRYFDLRPVLYDTVFYTGHFQEVESHFNLGCNGAELSGASLSSILSQVADFMHSSGDLVILKFSHYYDRDECTFGFDDKQMTKLCKAVTSQLAGLLYDQPAGSAKK